jgi:hypothetical protein
MPKLEDLINKNLKRIKKIKYLTHFFLIPLTIAIEGNYIVTASAANYVVQDKSTNVVGTNPLFKVNTAKTADNRLELKKNLDNSISVELNNSDAIGGLQFSVNTQGGILLRSYEGTQRANAAGLALYQYAKDDSTLNVLLLAPMQSAFPAGKGAIGVIPFALSKDGHADTAHVFLSRVVMCNAEAHYLEVNTIYHLAWNLNDDAQLSRFTLEQNYSNPFNSSTMIKFNLPRREKVTITIYNILGAKLETIVNEMEDAGSHQIKWNGSRYPSGVYLYRLRAGKFVGTKRMLLVK